MRKQVLEAELALYRQVATYPECAGPSGPSPLRVVRRTVTDRGDFYDVDRRLHRLAFDHGIEFETLQMKAADGGAVSLEAEVNEPCWDRTWAPPAVPSTHDVAQMFRDRLQELQSLNARVAELRARTPPLRVTTVLRAVHDAWGEEQIVLGELRYANGQVTLRGAALGASARAAIEPALRRAGLDAPRVEWMPLGDCRAFAALARLSPNAPAENQRIPKNLFDERAAALCQAGPPAAAKPVKARGSGPISIRVRNADVNAIFLLLSELSPADGFIVEPDVSGRVDADLQNVTVAEALGALRDAGIAFVGPGPLHRVCKAPCGPPVMPEQEYAGEPVTMTLSDVEALDVFRILREISGLEIQAHELPGRVSIYARDVPWDRIFDGLASAIRRKYTLEDTGVFFDRGGASVDKVPIPGRWRTLIERDPKKIAVDELRVVAFAGSGGTWSAWARVPGSAKQLFRLQSGMELYDGKVVRVSAGDVLVRTAAGRDVSLP